MRRLLPLLLAAAACGRDLAVPAEPVAAAPRIDALALVGLEDRASADALPVLAGELVAVHGAALAGARVEVHGVAAPLRAAAPDRLVFEVPAVSGAERLDVAVESPAGRATAAAALRYDGPGAPAGRRAETVATQTPIRRLSPVRLEATAAIYVGEDENIGTLVLGAGNADSVALLVAHSGAGFSSVPVGVVPRTAAGRIHLFAGGLELDVVGLDREGRLGRGGMRFYMDGSFAYLPPSVVEPPADDPLAACAGELELILTSGGGAAVAAARDPVLGRLHLSVFDPETLERAGERASVPGDLRGWDVLPDDRRVILGATGEASRLLALDTQTGEAAPLRAGGEDVWEVVKRSACDDRIELRALAVRHDGGAIAVAYLRTDQMCEVTEVALDDGRVLSRGSVGPELLALSYALVAGEEALVGSVGPTLLRLARVGVAEPALGAGCLAAPDMLEVDASYPIPGGFQAALPDLGSMAEARAGLQGSRVLALAPGGQVVTVLAGSMTTLGEVWRPAAYGAISVAPFAFRGAPLVVAEHTRLVDDSLDTAGTVFLLPLSGDAPATLGPPAYGRGVLFVEDADGVGVIQLPGESVVAVESDEPVSPDSRVALAEGCGNLAARPGSTVRPPELIARGPALAGGLGPTGVERFGPTDPPVYLLRADELAAVPSSDPCLAGSDLGACAGGALPLATPAGRRALDVTPSAGDRVLAVRRLDTSACPACAGDPSCERRVCPVAAELALVSAGAAPRVVELPAAPVGVAADRAGGFLVTVGCPRGPGADDCEAFLGCEGRAVGAAGAFSGGLLRVGEDGAVACVAAGEGLAGPLGLTPNGREAWIAGSPGAPVLHLVRLALARDPVTGDLDLAAVPSVLGREDLGATAPIPEGYPSSGVAFTADGSIGLVTVPSLFQIARYE